MNRFTRDDTEHGVEYVRADEAEAEILEQCRINGMGADREDSLRAEVERLNKAVADERERLYGKDIDTLLFEEHRLAFEKGRRSEREACAKVCSEAADRALALQSGGDDLSCVIVRHHAVAHLADATAIRARSNT